MLNLGGFCISFSLAFLPFASEGGTWLCTSHPGVVCSPAPLWYQHVLGGVDDPASNAKEGWNGVCVFSYMNCQ